MNDQAEMLRQKLQQSAQTIGRSVAVVSGKGGVGKSNFSINFAYALTEQQKRVLIVDMDLGMGNVHVLLGATPKYHFLDYLKGYKALAEVTNVTTERLHFISGGSGLNEVIDWTDEMFNRLTEAFSAFQTQYDVILFDMGAGANERTIELMMALDEIIVISTPEPTSITDAYSMIKYIALKDAETSFHLVGNRTPKKSRSNDAIIRLQFAMKRFLQLEANVLGTLSEDAVVSKAVMQQKPYVELFPRATITREIQQIARNFTEESQLETAQRTSNVLGKLKRIFSKGRDT